MEKPREQEAKASLIDFLSNHLSDSTVFPQFFSNLGIVFVFNGFSYLLLFIAQLVIAKYWGPEKYGEINLIGNITAFLFIPLSLGVNNAMYKYLPAVEERFHSRLMSTATIGSLLTIVFFGALFYSLYPVLFVKLKISNVVWGCTILYSITTTLTCVFESFLRGKKRFGTIGKVRLTASSLFFLAIVTIVFIAKIVDIRSYYLLYTVAYGGFFVAYTAAKLRITLFDFSFDNFKLIYRYGLLMMLTILLTALLYNSDMIILNYFVLDSKDLGIYASYQGIIRLLFYVGFQEIFNVVFLPSIANKDKKRLYLWIDKLAVPIVGLVMLSSALFITFTILLLGTQYILNPVYVFLSSLGISLYTLFQVHYSVVSMEGEGGALSALSCILLVLPIALILQIILIRTYLIPGAMVASVITNALLVISIHHFRRFARSKREGAPVPGVRAD